MSAKPRSSSSRPTTALDCQPPGDGVRAAMGLDRDPSDLPAAANGGSVSYRRTGGGLRGRAYEAGGRSFSA